MVSTLTDSGGLGDQIPAIKELMEIKQMGIIREQFNAQLRAEMVRNGFLGELYLQLDLAG